MTPRIDDLGFLSDCHSAVLVDRDGTVEWWCPPRFDSPSVFGRLLGPDAGHWSLRPTSPFTSERHYVTDTLALRTVVRTPEGEATVTDALALQPGARGHELGRRSPHVLLRRIEGRAGELEMQTTLCPRMEYGLTVPHVEPAADGALLRGGPVCLRLRSTVPVDCGAGSVEARFVVRAGETVELRLAFAPTFGAPAPERLSPTLEDTLESWRSWAALHRGYTGRHGEAVRRSALVLQGLTYGPSGAVVAAATTSLPENVGRELNFDYRFAWLRDLSLSIRSLWIAACPDEADRLFAWIARAAGHIGEGPVQIMYGVEGERDLTERELAHLPGFRDSRPVRVGNGAWDQKQLDVLGEVLDAAHQLKDQLGELDAPTQELLVALADRAVEAWREPDAGMWEARDEQRQYLSSKVMCWVALDRAVALAPRLGGAARPERWTRARERVREAVLRRGWSERAGAYTGAFGSDDLDASVLIMPLVGFLPAHDERMWATIRAVERELGDVGHVRRWPTDPMGFVICTYWLAECLALGGDLAGAEARFARATSSANDLGLLAEEADPDREELLGNFPQAFSHIGLINAAYRLSEAARDRAHPPSKEHG